MSPTLVPDFGRRIRLRRQALGLTQEELAERVGVDPSSVISWEKQRHKPARWQGKIEAVLGISLSPDAPVIDPALQRLIDGLTPEEKAHVIEQLTGTRPAPEPPPEPEQGEGRHRRNDRAGLAG